MRGYKVFCGGKIHVLVLEFFNSYFLCALRPRSQFLAVFQKAKVARCQIST